ncbi:MAG: Rnf-Nqr domain containing protein [candidate division WOR-3 bacterium]
MANNLLVLLINKISSNNVVLYSLLGICPLILYRINLQECLSTGIIIVVIMLVSSWLNLFIYHFLLLPLNFTHMAIVLFVFITYLTIHYTKIAMNQYYPSFAILFKQYPEFFYTNYAIYGTTMLNISNNVVFWNYTLSVLGSGLGYFIVIFIFMAIKERIYTIKRISTPSRLFMELSILALMSLVFSSITGLR